MSSAVKPACSRACFALAGDRTALEGEHAVPDRVEGAQGSLELALRHSLAHLPSFLATRVPAVTWPRRFSQAWNSPTMPAPEGEHADDEDRADDHGDPGADPVGQVVPAGRRRCTAPTTGPKKVPVPPSSVIRITSPEVDCSTSVSAAKLRISAFSEPARPAMRRRQHEGEQLVAVDVVAERDGARLVLADRLEHLAKGRMDDAADEAGRRDEDRQHEVVHVRRLRAARPGRSSCRAACPAGRSRRR